MLTYTATSFNMKPRGYILLRPDAFDRGFAALFLGRSIVPKEKDQIYYFAKENTVAIPLISWRERIEV